MSFYKLKHICRIIALCLVVIFGSEQICFAIPSSGTAKLANPFTHLKPTKIEDVLNDPSKLEIPFENVTLKEIYRGSSDRVIIHIQDAHANYSGQENLSKSLDYFMQRYPIHTVLVEGSEGVVTLSDARDAMPKKDLHRAAKRLLYYGIISGEEYLNLTTEHPMEIIGIEDEVLYQSNLNAYRDLMERREKILIYLRLMKTSLERIKNKLYAKPLLKYEENLKHSNSNHNAFKNQIDDLFSIAKQAGLSLKNDYTELKKLKVLEVLESSIDFEKANAEQSRLFNALSNHGAKDILKYYLDATKRAKNSPLTQHKLISEVLQIAEQNSFSVDQYAELSKYVSYLNAYQKIKLHQVVLEIDKFQDDVYRQILESQDARTLYVVDQFLELLEKAFRIQMTSHEYDQYLQNDGDFPTPSYQAFLNKQLMQLGYFDDFIPYEIDLDQTKESLKRFYSIVDERDTAFIKNAKKVLDSRKERVAFLIAGGYHTEHLTQIMRDQDISYVVLTPIVTSETDHDQYEKLLLAGKSKVNPSMESKKQRDAVRQEASRVAINERTVIFRRQLSSDASKLANIIANMSQGSRVVREQKDEFVMDVDELGDVKVWAPKLWNVLQDPNVEWSGGGRNEDRKTFYLIEDGGEVQFVVPKQSSYSSVQPSWVTIIVTLPFSVRGGIIDMGDVKFELIFPDTELRKTALARMINHNILTSVPVINEIIRDENQRQKFTDSGQNAPPRQVDPNNPYQSPADEDAGRLSRFEKPAKSLFFREFLNTAFVLLVSFALFGFSTLSYGGMEKVAIGGSLAGLSAMFGIIGLVALGAIYPTYRYFQSKEDRIQGSRLSQEFLFGPETNDLKLIRKEVNLRPFIQKIDSPEVIWDLFTQSDRIKETDRKKLKVDIYHNLAKAMEKHASDLGMPMSEYWPDKVPLMKALERNQFFSIRSVVSKSNETVVNLSDIQNHLSPFGMLIDRYTKLGVNEESLFDIVIDPSQPSKSERELEKISNAFKKLVEMIDGEVDNVFQNKDKEKNSLHIKQFSPTFFEYIFRAGVAKAINTLIDKVFEYSKNAVTYVVVIWLTGFLIIVYPSLAPILFHPYTMILAGLIGLGFGYGVNYLKKNYIDDWVEVATRNQINRLIYSSKRKGFMDAELMKSRKRDVKEGFEYLKKQLNSPEANELLDLTLAVLDESADGYEDWYISSATLVREKRPDGEVAFRLSGVAGDLLVKGVSSPETYVVAMMMGMERAWPGRALSTLEKMKKKLQKENKSYDQMKRLISIADNISPENYVRKKGDANVKKAAEKRVEKELQRIGKKVSDVSKKSYDLRIARAMTLIQEENEKKQEDVDEDIYYKQFYNLQLTRYLEDKNEGLTENERRIAIDALYGGYLMNQVKTMIKHVKDGHINTDYAQNKLYGIELHAVESLKKRRLQQGDARVADEKKVVQNAAFWGFASQDASDPHHAKNYLPWINTRINDLSAEIAEFNWFRLEPLVQDLESEGDPMGEYNKRIRQAVIVKSGAIGANPIIEYTDHHGERQRLIDFGHMDLTSDAIRDGTFTDDQLNRLMIYLHRHDLTDPVHRIHQLQAMLLEEKNNPGNQAYQVTADRITLEMREQFRRNADLILKTSVPAHEVIQMDWDIRERIIKRGLRLDVVENHLMQKDPQTALVLAMMQHDGYRRAVNLNKRRTTVDYSLLLNRDTRSAKILDYLDPQSQRVQGMLGNLIGASGENIEGESSVYQGADYAQYKNPNKKYNIQVQDLRIAADFINRREEIEKVGDRQKVALLRAELNKVYRLDFFGNEEDATPLPYLDKHINQQIALLVDIRKAKDSGKEADVQTATLINTLEADFNDLLSEYDGADESDSSQRRQWLIKRQISNAATIVSVLSKADKIFSDIDKQFERGKIGKSIRDKKKLARFIQYIHGAWSMLYPDDELAMGSFNDLAMKDDMIMKDIIPAIRILEYMGAGSQHKEIVSLAKSLIRSYQKGKVATVFYEKGSKDVKKTRENTAQIPYLNALLISDKGSAALHPRDRHQIGANVGRVAAARLVEEIKKVLPEDLVDDRDEMAQYIADRFGDRWDEAISMMGTHLINRDRRPLVERLIGLKIDNKIDIKKIAGVLHWGDFEDLGLIFEDFPEDFQRMVLDYMGPHDYSAFGEEIDYLWALFVDLNPEWKTKMSIQDKQGLLERLAEQSRDFLENDKKADVFPTDENRDEAFWKDTKKVVKRSLKGIRRAARNPSFLSRAYSTIQDPLERVNVNSTHSNFAFGKGFQSRPDASLGGLNTFSVALTNPALLREAETVDGVAPAIRSLDILNGKRGLLVNVVAFEEIGEGEYVVERIRFVHPILRSNQNLPKNLYESMKNVIDMTQAEFEQYTRTRGPKSKEVKILAPTGNELFETTAFSFHPNSVNRLNERYAKKDSNYELIYDQRDKQWKWQRIIKANEKESAARLVVKESMLDQFDAQLPLHQATSADVNGRANVLHQYGDLVANGVRLDDGGKFYIESDQRVSQINRSGRQIEVSGFFFRIQPRIIISNLVSKLLNFDIRNMFAKVLNRLQRPIVLEIDISGLKENSNGFSHLISFSKLLKEMQGELLITASGDNATELVNQAKKVLDQYLIDEEESGDHILYERTKASKNKQNVKMLPTNLLIEEGEALELSESSPVVFYNPLKVDTYLDPADHLLQALNVADVHVQRVNGNETVEVDEEFVEYMALMTSTKANALKTFINKTVSMKKIDTSILATANRHSFRHIRMGWEYIRQRVRGTIQTLQSL